LICAIGHIRSEKAIEQFTYKYVENASPTNVANYVCKVLL